MIKLSTGQDSTYKNYIILAETFFGKDSASVAFLKDRMSAAQETEDAEIIAPESQMIFLLNEIHHKGFN